MEEIIRQTAVAGAFYPAERQELEHLLDGFLADAKTQLEAAVPTPKALVVPHAGYIYSGPVAASTYASLIPARAQIRRVVLLGPSHRVPLQGLATSSATHFVTPLGLIPLDRSTIEHINALPQVEEYDAAHTYEHSLEVQLPFLQKVLDSFVLVPLVVGDAEPGVVSTVLETLWDGEETLIVISSDLSHYHDYETARRMDLATSKAIEALKPEDIHYDDACGRAPLNGLLKLAKEKGLQVKTIDLRNSGDTAGPRDQVVGYGAYLFY